jgi:hypothetical protein
VQSHNKLCETDFLSRDQLTAYVESRRSEAALRERTRGFDSYGASEASGLVSIRTSRPEPSQEPVFVSAPTCETGIYRRHEFSTALPVGFYPDPAAFEIDQQLMRLRRLKKNILSAARFHSKEALNHRAKPLMVTLTYRDDVEWSADQISRYMSTVKKWQIRTLKQLGRPAQPLRYVWVYEHTKRGRPHYHVLFWVPKGLTMPKADKRGWWPHGVTRTEWARHAVGYISKYASKGTDGYIPKGVRLYGVGGLSAKSRLFRAWWNLPVGIRKWGEPAALWRRALGGGWVSRRTGEHRPSQWRVILNLGRVFVLPRPQPTVSPFDVLHQALISHCQHMLFSISGVARYPLISSFSSLLILSR